ncbi:MAG: hypothetical protein JSW73_02835 [Candidatus Woesearchaeota archaeon]|nr:MAG: hypothetical protein JSW73_02835 [Candidatus Woesearchaeota archaeon]
MEILVDTNALIYAASSKIDIFTVIRETFTDAEILIPKEVIEELKKIREGARKLSDKRAASLILQIINKRYIKKIEMGEGNVDDLLIKEALKRKAAVITSDKNLKQKLKKANIKTIYLKQKKILEAD